MIFRTGRALSLLATPASLLEQGRTRGQGSDTFKQAWEHQDPGGLFLALSWFCLEKSSKTSEAKCISLKAGLMKMTHYTGMIQLIPVYTLV